MHRAKIICTLGPASDSVEVIRGLVDAGMSVARLNASHGTTENRAALIDRVRDVAHETDAPVATMLDLSGPEVRTVPAAEAVTLETGDRVRLIEGATTTGDVVGLSAALTAVSADDRVLLDDGRIETTVTAVDGDAVVVRVDAGGELDGNKGVNVPGVDLGLDAVTDDDYEELRLAAEANVAYVAASFVGDADDVYAVGEVLESFDAKIPIIAKIERSDAVANLDGILDAADGVMVARGDLGVECPLEAVPLIQKRIIRRAGAAGVPVITATEMLDSMIHAPRPTRAEASDVANAVLDGTDAVMLSGETAVGDHPIRVVETMARIVRDIEVSDEYAESREQRVPPAADTRTDALSRAARYLARDVEARAIVAATESGYTARKVAKYRPAMPIIAVTADESVRRRLALLWGVRPRHLPFDHDDGSRLIERAATAAIDDGAAESGDTIVVLSGMMTELEGPNTTNTLKVHLAADVLASGRAVAPGRAVGTVRHSADGDLTEFPNDSVVVLPASFDGEFTGELSKLAAVVSADPAMTSHTAMVARELGVPMVGDVDLAVENGTTVTVDGERGVVYEASIPER